MSKLSSPPTPFPPWQAQYGTAHHAWTTHTSPTPLTNTTTTFTRPLGTVEHSFSIDGTDYCGRADVHGLLTLHLTSTLSPEHLRSRITLAWAVLRTTRGLLRARVELHGAERRFVVGLAGSVGELVGEAEASVCFVGDFYGEGKGEGERGADVEVFWRHSMNCSRLLDPATRMARMFVLPLEPLGPDGDKFALRTLLVAGHDIVDGLTSYAWHAEFTRLLNLPAKELMSLLAETVARPPSAILAALPPAQEDLYPPLRGSPARQRWSWLLTRILRHVRRPPPAAFQNPLRREKPLAAATPMPHTFAKVLDYSRTPPLNSFTASVTLSPGATAWLRRLCREAGVSVGAGGFALVGMSLMALHERRYPHVPAQERLPFVGHFPVNPRPFFGAGKAGVPDSMMLAFSDGLALPFLPEALPVEGRFRLLARQAHRQLGVYQKRVRSAAALAEMGSRSPAQLLPANYLALLERLAGKMDVEGVKVDPQGGYPARMPLSPGTCGVSSVGSVKELVPAQIFPVVKDEGGGGVFAANWVGLKSAVRVRDGEFLVGSAGDDNGLHFGVSYDGNAIEEERVEEWTEVIGGLLEENDGRKKAVVDVRGKL